MAKITDFQAITLSSLSNEDVFHMVDLSGDSIIGSRKLSYEVLKKGIDRDIEKVQVIKGCSYNKDTKTIELSVGLSDGGIKVLSISMEELNIYHAEDGLSTKIGDDNTFVVDWDKVSRREHEHKISDVNELCGNLEDIYEELGKKALSVHTHVKSDITNFGEYLSVNSLVGISNDWTYKYSKTTLSNEGYEVISRLGTLAYKNEISASEVCGYEDTKYTAGNGLKLEGTEFSISTDYIKRIETDGKLALSSLNDLNLRELAYKDESEISSHYLPSNALDNLSGNWEVTYETVSCLSGNWNIAHSRVSALLHNISGDIGSIGYKNSLSTSDILGYEDTKYSNGFGLSANGTEFGVDTDKIALKEHTHTSNDITDISDYVAKSDNLSIINNNEISDYVLKTEVSSYEEDPKFTEWKDNSTRIHIGLSSTNIGDNSIAIGYDTKSTGNSTAVGRGAKSTGGYSTAIGYGAKVTTQIAAQIGEGTNKTQGSLQYRTLTIVKPIDYLSVLAIPNKSLELCSVSGILSSDGKGNIIGTEEYVHPTYINKELGLYKISVDNGHVGGVVSVSKEDITSLGIPGQDTSYSNGNAILISDDNSINVVLSDIVDDKSNISVISNKLYVEPSISKVKFINWYDS